MATSEAKIQNKIRVSKTASEEKKLVESLRILNEQSDAAIKAEKIKLSSEEDLESLLKLAEELKEKIEKIEGEIRRGSLTQFFLILSALVVIFLQESLFVYGFYSSISIKFRIITYILVITISTIFIILFRLSTQKRRQELFSDKLALKEVLQLLREVHGTIAEREDWSILKRAEFRIRLSRFDLSEKKESVFNFFS